MAGNIYTKDEVSSFAYLSTLPNFGYNDKFDYYVVNENTTVNNINYWSCNSYQLTSGCNKVMVGSSVPLNNLPGIQEYNNYNNIYNHTSSLYDRIWRKQKLQILFEIQNKCVNHSYPSSNVDISSINAGDIIKLSTFMDCLSDEYIRRKEHLMYRGSNEAVNIGGENLTLDSAYNKLTASINLPKNANIAVYEIMNNIVKVLKVMDKGTSKYKDDNNGKKVTDDLKFDNLPGDLIVAKNRNNQGDKILKALSVISRDCVCYSDCIQYGVCYCYGHCNNY